MVDKYNYHFNKIACKYNQIAELSAHIDEFVTLLPKGKLDILDVGCGNGYNAEYLSNKYGFNITGIDIAEEMLKYAIEKLPNGNFIVGDFINYSFDKKFDAVLMNDFIIHILHDDLSNALDKAGCLLKNNGLLFITTNLNKADVKIMPEPLNTDIDLVLNFTKLDKLKDLIKQANFEIIKIIDDGFDTEEGFEDFQRISIFAKKI